MKRKPLKTGSFLLTFGLIIFQFGGLVILHQTKLMGQILNVLGDVSLIELFGILIQLLGIVLMVSGLALLVDGVVTVKLENEIRASEYRILAGMEERVNNLLARYRNAVAEASIVRTCKFCAAQLSSKDVFCPRCGKSQK